jgi:hypothetical protein
MNKSKNFLSVYRDTHDGMGKTESSGIGMLARKVDEINLFLKREVLHSHISMGDLQARNRHLAEELALRKEQIEVYERRIEACEKVNQGKHQLIEKLLSDIGRYQQDIDWYKRTYEKRNFFGILRSRFRNAGQKSTPNMIKRPD